MANIKFKKEEGQHILKNFGLIDTIIKKAKVSHTDVVLEIGAGTGSITLKLLEKAKKVIAYESDRKLASELKKKVNRVPNLRDKLELIEGDALENDFPHFDICISNIPFNLSCPIILKLLCYDFRHSYILVQKEFGQRLFAKAGSSDYSRISVIAGLLTNISHVMAVSKRSFVPEPKVDTCFVKIEPKIKLPIDVLEFDNFLKICFNRKNKTVLANLKTTQITDQLKNLPKYSEEDPNIVLKALLDHAELLQARTAKMDINSFLKLFLEFKKLKIKF